MSKNRHREKQTDTPGRKGRRSRFLRSHANAANRGVAESEDAAFIGKWRIAEMDQWNKKYLDEDGPAYMSFEEDHLGQFHFLLIHATVDWSYDAEVGRVESSFQGFEEMDEICGRGWAKVDGKQMVGEIAIHLGDESGFKARKMR